MSQQQVEQLDDKNKTVSSKSYLGISVICIVSGLLLFPFGLIKFIKFLDDVFPSNTWLRLDDGVNVWFTFWGSYLGCVASVAVFFITNRITKAAEKERKAIEIERGELLAEYKANQERLNATQERISKLQQTHQEMQLNDIVTQSLPKATDLEIRIRDISEGEMITEWEDIQDIDVTSASTMYSKSSSTVLLEMNFGEKFPTFAKLDVLEVNIKLENDTQYKWEKQNFSYKLLNSTIKIMLMCDTNSDILKLCNRDKYSLREELIDEKEIEINLILKYSHSIIEKCEMNISMSTVIVGRSFKRENITKYVQYLRGNN